jgi:beta-N-acetylhexosaminidase
MKHFPVLITLALACSLAIPVSNVAFGQSSASKPASKSASKPAIKTRTAFPANPSLDVKLGQMLLFGFRGKALTSDSAFVREIRSGRVGNVILFDYDVPTKLYDRNIESPAQVCALTDTLRRAAPLPLLVSIDQEGGRVSRLKANYGFPPSVSQQYLGGLNNLDSTAFYAARTATMLAEAGLNLNFAPDTDVNANPQNPVIGGKERSFSADPALVAAHAAVVVREHRKRGVATSLKHFPGHGSSEADSHEGFVDVTSSWTRPEMMPFARLIKQGAVDMIMTAHIFNKQLDTVPATLSKRIITGILRDSLKYRGVVISDDMQMGAIAAHYTLEDALERCVNAGVDILCFGNNLQYEPDIVERAHSTLKRLVEQGRISRKRVDESYKRIVALKQRVR